MRIAVDAMGGDRAPEEIVRGAIAFVNEDEGEVVLVGDERVIVPLAKESPLYGERLHVVHASDRVAMNASPTEAVRKQKDASIVVATRLVKEGEADAVVSAGNTGVAMVAALMGLGRIRGVERPAIGAVLPTLQGACIVLDVGANVDSRPSHLVQFAGMGTVYAEEVLGIPSPRVALLSNGEEEGKGSELVVNTYERLRKEPRINFIGNVEGRDLFAGHADVLVCDGFIGNVVLKLSEGFAQTIFTLLKEALGRDLRSKVGALLVRPTLKDLWLRMDYTEYGGAPLLGVSGVCIISHGSSNAKAIRHAIRVAKESVQGGVTDKIRKMSEERVVDQG